MKKKEVDKKLHFCRERTARRFSSPRAAIERFKSRDERFPPVRRFHRKLWIPARHRGAVGQIIHVEEKASQVIDGPRRERERDPGRLKTLPWFRGSRGRPWNNTRRRRWRPCRWQSRWVPVTRCECGTGAPVMPASGGGAFTFHVTRWRLGGRDRSVVTWPLAPR